MPSIAYEFDQQPPIQQGVKGIKGSPEGVLKAPPGYEVANTITGKRYVKGSSADVNTGWQLITSV